MDLTETFGANLKTACADYVGAICDCQPPDLVARCIDQRCAAVPRADDCFSPTQNLEIAYDTGAFGCACADTAKAICIGRFALICEPAPMTTGSVWTAVEDGPCAPRPDTTCQTGEVRAAPDACLSEFNTCYQLPTGEFCGLP